MSHSSLGRAGRALRPPQAKGKGLRVIVDTNILCSALIAPGGMPDRLYLAWRDRLFTLLTSGEQLDEFRRVTRYPRIKARIDSSAAGTLHNELQHLAVVLRDLPQVDVSPV